MTINNVPSVRVIGSNSRCVKADIIPQHLPSADLGPYMRTHIETTAVGGREAPQAPLTKQSEPADGWVSRQSDPNMGEASETASGVLSKDAT